jgi:hypothetical protein
VHSCYFFLLLTREFLETYKYLPKRDKIFKPLIIINVMVFVLANFGARQPMGLHK